MREVSFHALTLLPPTLRERETNASARKKIELQNSDGGFSCPSGNVMALSVHSFLNSVTQHAPVFASSTMARSAIGPFSSQPSPVRLHTGPVAAFPRCKLTTPLCPSASAQNSEEPIRPRQFQHGRYFKPTWRDQAAEKMLPNQRILGKFRSIQCGAGLMRQIVHRDSHYAPGPFVIAKA